MFVAMEHLVGKEIAAAQSRVTRGQPLDEAAIGRHRAERSEVVLAGRAEQFRPRAVMRGAEDDDQLGTLAPAKLVVGPRVGRGAAARIDMRSDEAGEAAVAAIEEAGAAATSASRPGALGRSKNDSISARNRDGSVS